MRILFILLTLPLLASDQFFPEQLCKVSAPTGYAWLDPEPIFPGALAVAADESQETLILLASPAPDGVTELTDELIGYLEEGLLGGELRKVSSQAVSFKGISAHEVHVAAPGDNINTVRFFVANGFMYQLQIAGCKLPVDARSHLSLIFDRFDFMSEAEAAEVTATIAAMKAAEQAELEEEMAGPSRRKFIIIGAASIFFVSFLVLFIVAARWLKVKD